MYAGQSSPDVAVEVSRLVGAGVVGVLFVLLPPHAVATSASPTAIAARRITTRSA